MGVRVQASASFALRPSTLNALPRRRADARSPRLPFFLFSSPPAISSAPSPAFPSLSPFDLRLRTPYRADSPSSRHPFLPLYYPLALVLLSALFGRLSHLRQQHGSLELCINPSHLDFDNFSLPPLGTQLGRTNSQRVDTKLRAKSPRKGMFGSRTAIVINVFRERGMKMNHITTMPNVNTSRDNCNKALQIMVLCHLVHRPLLTALETVKNSVE
jgi:hypothetical protein